MEAVTATRLDALRADLAGVALADDAATLKLKSRDFFWFSPILKPILDDKRADLVALPKTKDDVMRIAAACARYRVPLTVRGGGTGNYGQAVPLAGGVVIDMVGLDRTVAVAPGAGRFEAGARTPRGRPVAPRYRRGRAALGASLSSLDPEAGDDRRFHCRGCGRLRLVYVGADFRSRRHHRG